MKNLFYVSLTLFLFSCDSDKNNVVANNNGVSYSSAKLSALQKPSFGTMYPEEFLKKDKLSQMEVFQQINSKLNSQRLNDLEAVNLPWKETESKINDFLIEVKGSEYLSVYKQHLSQVMLIQTNLLEDTSIESTKTIISNLENLVNVGSNSIGVINYVFVKMGNRLEKSFKSKIAKEILTSFNKKPKSFNFSKDEELEMAKTNNKAFNDLKKIKNEEEIAFKELSKY
jgi:hypothetical protein